MNKLREEVEKKGDIQVKNLQVNLKSPALDYNLLVKGNWLFLKKSIILVIIIRNIYKISISMLKLLPIVNFSDNNVYLNKIHSRKFANSFIVINNQFAYKVIFKDEISAE